MKYKQHICQNTTFSYANHHPSLTFFQAGIGKHNGSYQGTQLFVCPAGHGSFAKAAETVKRADLRLVVVGFPCRQMEKVELGVSMQYCP